MSVVQVVQVVQVRQRSFSGIFPKRKIFWNLTSCSSKATCYVRFVMTINNEHSEKCRIYQPFKLTLVTVQVSWRVKCYLLSCHSQKMNLCGFLHKSCQTLFTFMSLKKWISFVEHIVVSHFIKGPIYWPSTFLQMKTMCLNFAMGRFITAFPVCHIVALWLRKIQRRHDKLMIF